MRPGLQRNPFPLPLRPGKILTKLLLTHRSQPVNAQGGDQPCPQPLDCPQCEPPSTQYPETSRGPRATVY